MTTSTKALSLVKPQGRTGTLSTTTRLRTRTLADLLAVPLPVQQPLLDGLLKEGQSLMLWAAPGVGKTMVALSMALAVAGGGQFLAWKAPAPKKVLYVDGEMHLGDLQERLRDLMGAVKGLDEREVKGNLVVMARQDQDPDTDFPDIAAEPGQDEIFTRVVGGKFDLVILDNFSVLAQVNDENDAAAMAPVLAFLMRLKQANKAAILVHHSGKGGNDYRGSSKLATTFEVIAGLTAATGIESRYPASFDMRFDKFRNVRGESIEATRAWLSKGSDGALEWKFKASEDAQLSKLVEAVRSGQFSRQSDLATALDWSVGKTSNMRQVAIRKGCITADEWSSCMASVTDHEEAF